MVTHRFRDRDDAGRRLAEALAVHEWVDPVVLALPRGGVPVAVPVATRLRADLDVLVARKVGAPGHREFGVGAIAEGGVRVADGASLRSARLSPAEFERLADAEEPELRRRVEAYRHGRRLPHLSGRDVIVVDDGLATGVTAEAAFAAARRLGADRIVLAAPVCAADTAERFEAIAEAVVCVLRPHDLVAVGRWYDDFRQVTDADVIRLLDR